MPISELYPHHLFKCIVYFIPTTNTVSPHHQCSIPPSPRLNDILPLGGCHLLSSVIHPPWRMYYTGVYVLLFIGSPHHPIYRVEYFLPVGEEVFYSAG